MGRFEEFWTKINYFFTKIINIYKYRLKTKIMFKLVCLNNIVVINFFKLI